MNWLRTFFRRWAELMSDYSADEPGDDYGI